MAPLSSLVSLAVVVLAAFGAGRPLVRLLGMVERDGLAHAVWSLALGFLVCGLLLIGLALGGWLYRPVIGLLTLAGSFWGLAEIFHALGSHARPLASVAALPALAPPWSPPSLWLRLVLLSGAGVACLSALVAALAPPTAGDALCYHLQLPKVFLAEHRLLPLPYDDNATFPMLAEMWFLWGLALEGGVTAQLIHWTLGLLFALAAVLLATPVIGRPWAWICGAVVALVPGVTNQMTAPLNDVALALYTTLALVGWREAARADGPTRTAWLAAAGLSLGAALSIKFVALVFAAALLLTWLWSLVRQATRRRELLSAAAVVAVLAVGVSCVWYARAAWQRGNPVYPFFDGVFSAQGPEVLRDSKTPLAWQLHDLASAAWQATMHPERFGGRGHQLGALFLVALPGLVLCRRVRGLGSLLALAALFGLFWFGLRQNLRFLLPVVPLLSVGVSWVWLELGRFPAAPRLIAVAVLLALSGFNMAIAAARAVDKLPVALGLESREDFLRRVEPSWEIAQQANKLLSPGDHLLSQDYRGFYFHDRFTRESIYRRRTEYHKLIDKPGELSRRLRAAGFTHLLLAETLAGPGARFNRKLARLVEQQFAAERELPPRRQSLRELARCEVRDSEGATRLYRLVALQ